MKKQIVVFVFMIMNIILSILILSGCSIQDKLTLKSDVINNEKVENIEFEVNEDEILNTIKDITTQTREFGSSGEKNISEKIKNKLETYGYNVEFQDFEVFDVGSNIREYMNSDDKDTFFNLNPTNSTNPKGIARNIIIKSNDFDLKKKTLYICAHYDTTSNTTGVYDNASGVSSVIEIARNLQNYKNDEVNIVYTIFSAEEYFKAGSRYYLSQLSDLEKENTIGAINIDMVGYEGFEYEGYPKVGGIEVILMPGTSSNSLNDYFNGRLNNKYNVNCEMGGMSDDISFSKLGIPTMYFADENFATGFEIERKSTELQLKPLNISSISSLCEDIIEFIQNLDVNKLK